MPQGPARLRQKFMIEDDDGIERCESIIKGVGGTIKQGVISFPKYTIIAGPDLGDAIDYLCLEWDYTLAQEKESMAIEGNPQFNHPTTKGIKSAETRALNPEDPANGLSLKEYEKLDYKPLWDFILCLPLERKTTKGGIVLPDNSRGLDDTRRCLVVKAGPGSFNASGAFIANPIRPGQYIYNMAKHMQPYKVMIDGKLYLSMPSSEVLAVADTPGGDWEATAVTEEEVVEMVD